MPLPESEAKTKWCPFQRVPKWAGDNLVAVNDPAMPRDSGNCIGSHCMLWRWREPESYTRARRAAAGHADFNNIAGERVGYCGLSHED